jgi:CSLREA domain-containing protein
MIRHEMRHETRRVWVRGFLTTVAFALVLAGALTAGSTAAVRASTTFVVNRITDAVDLNPGNGICDSSTNSGKQCTLRAAIQEANALSGADTITFNISTTSKVIAPSAPLPPITETLTINGYSQSGATANTQADALNTVLRIVLDGVNAGAGAAGLDLQADNSVVKGLVVQRWDGDGILIEGAGSAIRGNFIGTDRAGTAGRGNRNGVHIIGPSNVIGGTAAGARNLISGNTFSGVVVEGGPAVSNVIQGNLLGLDRSGTEALGNTMGVVIDTGPGTTVGGLTAAARNVISGNTSDGVYIHDEEDNSAQVQGNYIGTDVTGTKAIANLGDGVDVRAESVAIGGNASARNVISGNQRDGIDVYDTGFVAIQGNYIGVDKTGAAALGNGRAGIRIEWSADNTIGGTAVGEGNVVAGNNGPGLVFQIGSTRNDVLGNLIGTDATGTIALGNSQGINLEDGDANLIGSAVTGGPNLISGNLLDGVAVGPASSGNQIIGNRIGTKADGTGDLGNQIGIDLQGPNTIVGNATSGGGNLISGNVVGVKISGASATGNTVQGNVSRLNDNWGIDARTGPATITGNVITSNGKDGIGVNGATGVRISGNQFLANGELGIDLAGGTQDSFGVTSNDNDDPDSGSNNLQNFPVLAGAVRNSSTHMTTVAGSLNSTPSSSFRIELYLVVADASGHGEGQVLLANTTITTDSGGNKNFGFQLGSLSQGQKLTALAIATSSGDTSEFSANVTVVNV